MQFRILKRDLWRKKSINVILVIFILLATVFLSSSINNMAVISNAIDYFMEVSGISDYIVLTMGDENGDETQTDQKLVNFLENEKTVTSYEMDTAVCAAPNQLYYEDGKQVDSSNAILFCEYKIHQQRFFDHKNNEITSMEDGTIYICKKVMDLNHLKTGEKIVLKSDNGYQKSFKIVGDFKDAMLGSEIMGLNRFIITQNDFVEIRQESQLPIQRLYSIWTDELEAFSNQYLKNDFSVIFNGDVEIIKMTYVMYMIIAAVLLLLSGCLIAISLVMLRFTILFTIDEDFKEIGIMKAIGMKDHSIRRLYLSKYIVLSMMGSLIGFIFSIPFGRLLLDKVTSSIVVNQSSARILTQFILSVLVAVMVILFTHISTAKIKKTTPMDAIRCGNNGERFHKKGKLELGKSNLRVTSFLAGNDVVSSFKKFVAIFFAGVIGIWLIIMPVNTINTLSSSEIASWFNLSKSDLYIDDGKVITELMIQGNHEAFLDYIQEVEDKLAKEKIEIDQVVMEAAFQLKVEHNERVMKMFSLQGIGTKTSEYIYDEGKAPIYDNEIAMTHISAKKLGVGIGDAVTIVVDRDGTKKSFIITGFYQSMNNMGQGIRLTPSAQIDYFFLSGCFAPQIKLNGTFSEKERKEMAGRVAEIFPGSNIMTTHEWIMNLLGGISDQLNSLKSLILLVVIAIIVLIIALMQRMFMIRERGEIAMLKAIGLTNSKIISWQTKRIGMVFLLGIFVGLLTGTPFSKLTSGQAFKMMGASDIQFYIKPMEIYVLYPIILLATSMISCIIVMQQVKTIQIQEINTIE